MPQKNPGPEDYLFMVVIKKHASGPQACVPEGTIPPEPVNTYEKNLTLCIEL